MQVSPPVSVAIALEDLDPNKIILSELKHTTRTWKEKNELKSRSSAYCNVYYGTEGVNLVVVMKDLRTNSGIQVSKLYNSLFMSVNLDTDQSKALSHKLDGPVTEQLFTKRFEVFPNKARAIASASMMGAFYKGIVTAGKEKAERGVDGETEFWQDQITASVPMKKVANQTTINPALCPVEDMQGNPYAWTALDRTRFAETVIEIERINFTADACKAMCRYRLLVTPEQAAGRITTKRKLEQGTGAVDAHDVMQHVQVPVAVTRALPEAGQPATSSATEIPRVHVPSDLQPPSQQGAKKKQKKTTQ
jgi:hypothetical protein